MIKRSAQAFGKILGANNSGMEPISIPQPSTSGIEQTFQEFSDVLEEI